MMTTQLKRVSMSLAPVVCVVAIASAAFGQAGPGKGKGADSGSSAASRIAPWIIAHRGASGVAPENTMAAFRQAVADGADALELDCQRTKDNRLVVLHDHDLFRTTGIGKTVSELTLAEIQALDVGAWKGARFAGEKIPTLEQVIELALEADVGLVVEAKTPYELDPGLVERIVETLDAGGALSRTVIQSFDHRSLREVTQLRRDVKSGPLVSGGIDAIESVLADAGTWVYLPNFKYMLPDRVQQIHDLGYRVCVWTVDNPNYMLAMIRRGVDGIMTNYPARLKKLVDEMKLRRRPWPR